MLFFKFPFFKFLWLEFRFKSFLELHVHFKDVHMFNGGHFWMLHKLSKQKQIYHFTNKVRLIQHVGL